MKLLIAGCSFSQSQRDNQDRDWNPWSDMVDVHENVNVVFKVHMDQGMIV